MIPRRAVLAGIAAASPSPAARAALPVPQGGSLAFDVFRQGSRIGTHTLAFTREGPVLTVRVEIDLLVRFALIPVFRYRHRATERWQGDTLAGLEARTDNDGTALRASAGLDASGLVVQGSGTARYVAPADALTTTYWNRRLLLGEMISTQDGRLFRPAVRDLGAAPVLLAAGLRLPARRFALSGDLALDLWYAEADWVGLQFTANDGSVVSYRRL